MVVLENGEIVEIGNHKQLMKNGGLYHRLYTMSYAAAGDKAGEPGDKRGRTADGASS